MAALSVLLPLLLLGFDLRASSCIPALLASTLGSATRAARASNSGCATTASGCAMAMGSAMGSAMGAGLAMEGIVVDVCRVDGKKYVRV
jgi:hypothetical protein